MSIDDLRSIAGLEDKHVQVLARQLLVTTFRALVFADRRDIYRAMNRIRPRPTLEQIARWQDQARSKLSEPAVDPSDWHPAASFAVVFAQRNVDGVWERQLQAERTEVEPEREPAVWPGWDCAEICTWMLAQVGQPADHDDEAATTGPVGEDRAAATIRRPVRRGQLRIKSAFVVGPTGHIDLISRAGATDSTPRQLIAPERVAVTVTGAPAGHEVCAVILLRPEGEPDWHSEDPVIVDRSGRADLGLPPIAAGRHDLKLVVWSPDATAYPASMTVSKVTVSSAAAATA